MISWGLWLCDLRGAPIVWILGSPFPIVHVILGYWSCSCLHSCYMLQKPWIRGSRATATVGSELGAILSKTCAYVAILRKGEALRASGCSQRYEAGFPSCPPPLRLLRTSLHVAPEVPLPHAALLQRVVPGVRLARPPHKLSPSCHPPGAPGCAVARRACATRLAVREV